MSSAAPLPLISALRQAMPGRLARFAAGVAGPDDPRTTVGVDRLMGVARFTSLRALEQRTVGPVDPKAAVSVWTLAYFEAVLPVLLSADILLARMPCIDIDQVEFIVSPVGDVIALKVFGEPPLPCDDRLRRLIDGHLTPFIERVASCGGITRRVLWCNAGHIIEAFLGMLQNAGAGTEGVARVRDLLASSQLGRGSPNPLFRPIQYTGGKRLRRVCCLRFLTPDWAICACCPLAETNPARARRLPTPSQ